MFRTENTGLGVEYKTRYLKLQSVFHGRRVGLWMPLHLYMVPASILGSVLPCSSSTSISSTFYHQDGWRLRIRRYLKSTNW